MTPDPAQGNRTRIKGAAGLPCLADVDLILFDFDGVIADSEVISLASLRDTLRDFGLDLSLDEVRRRFLGTSLRKIAADVIEASPQGSLETFRTAWQGALFARFRAELQPIPGIVDLLDRLDERSIPFCIASSGSFERIGVALAAMGLEARFRHVFSADLVAHGKPAPDLFLHAAREMGVPPARCLVIEDSPFGIEAACSAGMRSAGFLGGAHLEDILESHADLLREAGAGALIHTLHEIGVGARRT